MHHLIDPKTGMPVKTDLAEVSVITDVALRGEVYAKCAMLLGASAGLAFLESRGVRYAVVPVAGNGDDRLPAAA
jgi:thiamine biosynthesis lipoprotein